MSQQVSARTIGLFSIGAIILFVIGILVFGSGDWFKEQNRIEMVFTGSVKGLYVGSSITYRGMRIGEVEKITIAQYGEDINIRVIGVIVQQESDRNIYFGSGDKLNYMFDKLVKEGVRAQLVQESLVTGRLQIQLEFLEDSKGYAPPSISGYSVLPTVPSEIEKLGETVKAFVNKFEDLPIKEIADNLAATTEGINSLVNSREVKVALVNLSQSLVHFNHLMEGLDKDKEVITGEMLATAKALREMADSFTDVANKSEPLIAAAGDSFKNIDRLLGQTSKTLETYEHLVQPGSELSVTLIQTLQSFERASEQVRQLAETLQRNPESILTGKQR